MTRVGSQRHKKKYIYIYIYIYIERERERERERPSLKATLSIKVCNVWNLDSEYL